MNYSTPVHYFSQRFSLCVLDTIRQLQKLEINQIHGVSKCQILEYLEKQNFIDGDILAQMTTALNDLELCGLIMKRSNDHYKTLGPLAKICLAKNAKQRRLAWDKLEENVSSISRFNKVNGDETTIVNNCDQEAKSASQPSPSSQNPPKN